MEKHYRLVFDEHIAEQLKKLKDNESIRSILSKMFDKIEEQGIKAGKRIDSQLHLYEMKNKHPPIRLYFKEINNKEILLFEFELKTSEKKQKKTIGKLKHKIMMFFKTLCLPLRIFFQ